MTRGGGVYLSWSKLRRTLSQLEPPIAQSLWGEDNLMVQREGGWSTVRGVHKVKKKKGETNENKRKGKQ